MAPSYWLTRDIESRQRPGHLHQAGTEVVLVEPVGEEWFVEVRVTDPQLEGEAWFETLQTNQRELVEWPPEAARNCLVAVLRERALSLPMTYQEAAAVVSQAPCHSPLPLAYEKACERLGLPSKPKSQAFLDEVHLIEDNRFSAMLVAALGYPEPPLTLWERLELESDDA